MAVPSLSGLVVGLPRKTRRLANSEIIQGLTRFARSFWGPIVVACCYYAGTQIGFALTPTHTPISTFWPPNSILLAALLLTPRRKWWMLLLAVLPAHLLAQLPLGVSIVRSLGWFVGNTGEALLGAGCIIALNKRETLFNTVRGVVVFLLFGVLLAPLFTSFLDAITVVATGRGGSYWLFWNTRLFSNMLAELTLVPVIVIFASSGLPLIRQTNWRRLVEAIFLGVGVVLVTVLTFGGEPLRNSVPDLVYAPLPLLLWATVRFGPGGLSLSLLTVSLLSIWNAMHGRGPFTTASMPANVFSLQLLLCVIGAP